MKLIVDIIEGIVRRVQRVEDSVISNVTDSYPYCKDDDLGNGYAVSKRKKDNYPKEGKNFDMVVLPDADPGSLMGKRYNSDGSFSLANESEAERKRIVGVWDSKYRIKSEAGNLYPSVEQVGEIVGILGQVDYDRYVEKIMRYEQLTDNELNIAESLLPRFNHETRLMVINQIANNIKSDPGEPEKLALAKKWWYKLLGTRLENKGVSAVAGTCVLYWKFKEAVDMYKAMKSSGNLSANQVIEVDEKIATIGVGQDIFDRAREIYDAAETARKDLEILLSIKVNDPEGSGHKAQDKLIKEKKSEMVGLYKSALGVMREFTDSSTGLTKVALSSEADKIIARCLGRIGRAEGDKSLVIDAIEVLGNRAKIKF